MLVKFTNRISSNHMLELNNYSIQKIENLKDFLLVYYIIIDDIYHQIIPDQIHYTMVLADKGYIGNRLYEDIRADKGITLLALKRSNSKRPYPKVLRNWISKHRRRIETSFSQLVNQFHIDEVLANSLDELKARIQSKILGHNISYFMNKCLGNKATGHIKHLIFE